MRLFEVTQKYKLNIKSAKEGYSKRLNGRTKTSLKPFCQFIKGYGSDYLGINEIEHNHHLLLDDTEKATCLHDYFRSIFLPKRSNCPPPQASTIPLMEPGWTKREGYRGAPEKHGRNQGKWFRRYTSTYNKWLCRTYIAVSLFNLR